MRFELVQPNINVHRTFLNRTPVNLGFSSFSRFFWKLGSVQFKFGRKVAEPALNPTTATLGSEQAPSARYKQSRIWMFVE
jgi:hypothetical protein